MTLTQQELFNARILIVDDQPANVALLEAMLEEAGYTQVSSTREPDKVCAMHRHEPFDLILLDLQMPGMDGFQVLEALKASTADNDYLPVLVVTAQPGHKLRALQSGAKDFVSKPFDMVEVKARIRNLLEVRLLHKHLERHNLQLEELVKERTAELLESEARYRALTELSTDWYWEQDGEGRFTKVSGPVLEMLGLHVDTLNGEGETSPESDGWDEAERQGLRARIASRSPFLDMVLSRVMPDGKHRQYRVSGTPMFDSRCTLIGYRGYGVEVLTLPKA
jgi:PAS domain S-box-containing protein